MCCWGKFSFLLAPVKSITCSGLGRKGELEGRMGKESIARLINQESMLLKEEGEVVAVVTMKGVSL